MGFLDKLVGGAAAAPIDAIGKIVDDVFTSEEEKLDKQIIMERLAQKPHLIQAEINKVEAQHRSVFVAGWRPALGWICATGLAVVFVFNPIAQWWTGEVGPDLPLNKMVELVIAMLGLAGLRTAEKVMGRAK